MCNKVVYCGPLDSCMYYKLSHKTKSLVNILHLFYSFCKSVTIRESLLVYSHDILHNHWGKRQLIDQYFSINVLTNISYRSLLVSVVICITLVVCSELSWSWSYGSWIYNYLHGRKPGLKKVRPNGVWGIFPLAGVCRGRG